MLTLLIVDNNLNERKIAESILRRQGFDVATCSTDEAITLLSTRRAFDVAIVAQDLDLLRPFSGLLGAIVGIEDAGDVEIHSRVFKPYRQEFLLAAVFEAVEIKGLIP